MRVAEVRPGVMFGRARLGRRERRGPDVGEGGGISWSGEEDEEGDCWVESVVVEEDDAWRMEMVEVELRMACWKTVCRREGGSCRRDRKSLLLVAEENDIVIGGDISVMACGR